MEVFLKAAKKLTGGLRWRLRWARTQTVYWFYRNCLYWVAYVYRGMLQQPVFVGVTGSAGKSTTKDLIACILDRHLIKGRKVPGSANGLVDLIRLLLGTRPSDRYCIAEIATTGPGTLDIPVALFRPTVSVVTNIGDDHFSAFKSSEAIAQEKGKLIRSLPHNGIAILNADDPHVFAMRSQFSGRSITYGFGDHAMLMGEAVNAAWPDRLSLTVSWNGQSARVQTQLCGGHWAPVVLAGLAAGVALGVPLVVAAQAVAGMAPFDGRMSPVELGDGVTFIRDDWKAPLWTIAPILEFMRQARATRKVIVVGTISDYQGDSTRRYVEVAQLALASADCVIFVGPRASACLRAKRDPTDQLLAFPSLRDASTYLAGYLQPGDLVLLKGSTRPDHLERLIFARTTGVKCWRSDCGYMAFCNACDRFGVESGPLATEVVNSTSQVKTEQVLIGADLLKGSHAPVVVVGLGNPQYCYESTPHNVGQSVVDILAQRLGETWQQEGELAMVARTYLNGYPICLVKLLTPMNNAGSTLRSVATGFGFDKNINNCILVHDDLDLPIGKVRVRMRGGDGGHRGVQSIVQSFQDDRFRRVKIGVGRPSPGASVFDYVLTPFSPMQTPTIISAYEEAIDRIHDLIGQDSIAELLIVKGGHARGASINPKEITA